MDKRINAKTELYRSDFIENVKEKATALGMEQDEKSMQLLQYIFDYDRLSFQKEDFQKRKRVKNHVPAYDRCCAIRANNEQCSRRKKVGHEYCGTHTKGTPHGITNANSTGIDNNNSNVKKIELWTQDIKGINYFIDNNNNVYDPTDINQGKQNPKIIAKYTKQGNEYHIPEFHI